MVPGKPAPTLRICFFNRSYHPDFGATGQLLTELAQDLVQKHGYRVTVVAGPPSRSGRHDGVQIVRACGTAFRPTRFAGRAVNYLSYFLSACLRGLFIPKPDVVVFLTDPPIIGLAAFLTARRSGAKLVFLLEDIFPEVARLVEDFRSEAVNRLLHRIGQFLIRRSDRIIAVGETMRQWLIQERGADPQRVQVIHNWADCAAITPGPRKNPFSLANGLADRFVVMHSGNLGLSQSLDTLLDAAYLLRGHPDILFAIVGDGVKRTSLEARAHSEKLTNVRFFPYQPRQSRSELFASADLFIVSLRKGLAGYIVPSKLYGILAAGRPFVAATEEACEAAIIARQHSCGLLAKPGDAADLARQILILYNDGPLAQRLGANARQTAFLFDRPKAVRAYHNLFLQLCPPKKFSS